MKRADDLLRRSGKPLHPYVRGLHHAGKALQANKDRKPPPAEKCSEENQ